jgi:hypothetical protein
MLVIERDPDIAWVESEDRLALIDKRALDADPLVLSGSAMLLWALLETSASVDDLVRRASEHSGWKPTDIAPDVETWVDRCLATGILRRVVAEGQELSSRVI